MKKKIGILTSGGDSPGMNTAISCIVKECIKNNFLIYGFYNGYYGLYKNKIKLLNNYDLTYIYNQGGTFLKSSRFKKLKDIKIINKITKKMKNIIDVLIIIGGEGSYIGAKKLTDNGLPCITLPGTIDNDIYNTDYTIGYSTAINTITKCIDKIKNTSISHNRISIIEVMGRKNGSLAIASAISCMCDFIIIPEIKFNEEIFFEKIKKKINKNTKNFTIIITENICNIYNLSKKIEYRFKKETRATNLGYIQRGGSPIYFDRILATKMSLLSIELIKKNIFGVSIGIKNNKLIYNKLEDKIKNKKNKIDNNIIKIINYINK